MTEFKSKLSKYMIGSLEEKRANGYNYKREESSMKQLDEFLINNNLDNGTLTREIMMEYSKRRPNESNNNRIERVRRTNALPKYMLSLGLDAYISYNLGRPDKTIPYLPTKEELISFFTVVDTYRAIKDRGKYFKFEYPIIFRFYYCCGLRRSEAALLEQKNVDLINGIITIINSKNKSRIVYLAEDFRLLCIKYNQKVSLLVPNRKYFFPGLKSNSHISNNGLEERFHIYWRVSNPNHTGKVPTIHALRHCFITDKINEFENDETVDVNAMLPYFSKYVGHSTIQETYYYFHSLANRSPKVRNFVNANNEEIPEVIKYEDE